MIAHTYDDLYEPMSGIFFSDQAQALHSQSVGIGVVAVNFVSLKSIAKQKKFRFGLRKGIFEGKSTYIIDIPSVPFVKCWNRWLRNVLLIKLIKKYIKGNGLPDIAHVQVFYSGKAAIWLKNKHRIPFVITEHFSVFARKLATGAEMKFAAKIFKESNACIAVSKEFCSLLQNLFHVPFLYVPNVVNTEVFNLPDQSFHSEKKQLISVGSLDENKNHALLIQSLKAMSNIDFHLTIVGVGPLKQFLYQIVRELNLEKCVTFFGYATKQQLNHLLQQSDVFVLPSKYETFGVVLIEAMACGVPVVSTRCGGPESIIINEKLGMFCDADAQSLGNCISMALARQWDRSYIRMYAVENFSSEAVAGQLEVIYRKAIKND